MAAEPLDVATLPECDNEAPSEHVREHYFLALAVLWCRDEPWRVGELLLAPPAMSGQKFWFGRGQAGEDGPPKAQLMRLRPGSTLPSSPLGSVSISRYQLALETVGDQELFLQNQGRAALMHNECLVTEARCRPGDLLQLGKQLLLACVRRPTPARTAAEYPQFPFGRADAHGMVGESAAMWQLRQQIGLLALRKDAVLVYGAGGAGKELSARAIHALSARREQPLVFSSALAIRGTVVDAELFGSAEHQSNPGSPEKPGLLLGSRESTLIIDDFDGLPAHAQAQLLRAIEQGSHPRVGDGKVVTSDARLVAIVNRESTSLEPALSAHFPFAVHVPNLSARREDIPLLVNHLLRKQAERGDDLALRCFPSADPSCHPVVPLSLVRHLVQLNYTNNVRHLRTELWRALAAEQLGYREQSSSSEPEPIAAEATPIEVNTHEVSPSEPPPDLTAERVQAALDLNNGLLEATWRALGLKNRFVLLRLIKRYNLEVRKRPAQPRARSNKE